MKDSFHATRHAVLRFARATRADFQAKYQHLWLLRVLTPEERRAASMHTLVTVPESSGAVERPQAPSGLGAAIVPRRSLGVNVATVAGLIGLLRQDPASVGFHPIAKGDSRLWTERILLGRAQNNDIVIRHEGVSKLHAW